MNPSELLIGEISSWFDRKPCDALLLEAQSETWFSNQLAWLLDPKGSHGLGVKFLNSFVQKIAQHRSSHEKRYRKATNLKWGKEGAGVGTSGFQLSNASVFREFFLSRSQKRKADGALFCDLVVADLDSGDGLFLTIENKLFTTDRVSQLDDYEKCVNEKFKRAKIREFVYLTLRGTASSNATKDQNWVKLGWLTDIREILAGCLKKQQKTDASISRATELLSLLNWLNELSTLTASQHSSLKQIEVWLKRTSADLLLSELQRLNEGKTGEWKRDTRKRSSFLLQHSSFPSIGLQVGLASGLVATAQIRRSDLAKKSGQEKILLPLGAHPDQVLNLVDIAARDICNLFFQQKDKYVADKRRRKHRAIDPDVSKELEIVYRYRYELPILLKLISLGS